MEFEMVHLLNIQEKIIVIALQTFLFPKNSNSFYLMKPEQVCPEKFCTQRHSFHSLHIPEKINPYPLA